MRRTMVLSLAAVLGLTAGSVALHAEAAEALQRDRRDRPAIGRRADVGRGPMRFGGAPLGPGRAFGFGVRNLDLTAEQRTKMRELTTAARERTEPIVTELRNTQRSLRLELFADAPDRAKVEELSKQVASLQTQLTELRLETTAQLAEVLTPEQKARVREAAGREQPRGPARGGRGPARR